ncbi:MAG: hypothetical protein R3D98_01490 [Candidatus Krumholzibacteriia bacterium]
MQPDPVDTLFPGVASQLAHLAAALLTVGLAAGGTWWLRRRLSRTLAAEPTRPSGAATPPAPSASRLVPAGLTSLVALLLASGLRQIWPHPDLRARALTVLVITLVTAALAWWRLARRGESP